MKLEVMLSVMNLKKSDLDKMNITSKCIVINQCKKNDFEQYKNFNIYSYDEIGISNSRNRGLEHVKEDIIVICDDDVAVTYKQALMIDKYVFSNQIKYYYFRNKNSITGIHSTERAIDQYKTSYERYIYIKNLYPNMLENDIALLYAVVMAYNHNDKNVDYYLKENKVRKLFKQVFSLRKIFKCRLQKIGKIKIILYRINPNVERLIQKKYKYKI